MENVILHRPDLDELSFRQELLSDPATMSFNHAFGGTVAFPRERWADWYERWVGGCTGERFYRYLQDGGDFVGEVSYHWDGGLSGYVCDVIVPAACRGRGYGRRGLALLCEAARANGIPGLYDNIALDNPSVEMFLKAGFREVSRTEEYVLVWKELEVN